MAGSSDIKAEVHDVTVLHHIFLALNSEFAGFFYRGFAAEAYIIVIFDYLGADESLSKSVWIIPAHCGAFEPRRKVQARTSSGPAVK